ncbi:MAG: serine/threonine protein kinase [Pirellulales bacterium]|nr:serine/threonine protein kinase [Pirellulales bacterium]
MSETISAVMARTSGLRRTFLKSRLASHRTLWIWPIVALVLLIVLGWWLRSSIETAMKENLKTKLVTLLNADVKALELWFDAQKGNITAIAEEPSVKLSVGHLVDLASKDGTTPARLLASPMLQQLRNYLEPWIDAHDYQGFVIVDLSARVVAANLDDAVGKADLPVPPGLLEKIEAGEAMVTRPFRSAVLLPNEDGKLTAGLPTMFVVGPVRNSDGDVIAAFGLRIPPEGQFTEILSVARAGESGETYAFDADGVLLSQSRFDDDLKQIGLVADREDATSIFDVQIRDPGVDMTTGKRPDLRRSQQPLTRMAASAIAGETKVDVDGYRDYRGVPVIGAWTWLDDYGMGITTEVDVAEAYRPLTILRTAFWVLFAIILIGAIAIFAFTIIVAQLQRKIRVEAFKTKTLGQYSIDEKIGAGGMGTVYRGQHAMLRRPTAIKLLNVDRNNTQAIARFEREVQLTSQLTHPNTIEIYDYGKTPEGIFYYAMELLDGLTLEELVEKFGPQSEARVVHILKQMCGSLAEAHDIGLVHRDIKPANVMLCRRGGMNDVVKVLDFGLVKSVEGASDQMTLTTDGTLAGTPMYMPPEGFSGPDKMTAKSDIYAVGAVGYYLLTGTPVYQTDNLAELCMKQVSESPQLPSARLGQPLLADVEDLLLVCLDKEPEKRPASARVLAEQLGTCGVGHWTLADADDWWKLHLGDTQPGQASEAQKETKPPLDETMLFKQETE